MGWLRPTVTATIPYRSIKPLNPTYGNGHVVITTQADGSIAHTYFDFESMLQTLAQIPGAEKAVLQLRNLELAAKADFYENFSGRRVS
jgi:hypothetical protein